MCQEERRVTNIGPVEALRLSTCLKGVVAKREDIWNIPFEREVAVRVGDHTCQENAFNRQINNMPFNA